MKTYSQLVGDGGSDILGQVVALRQKIAERLTPIQRMFAIGSGKGGVGKSTLTMLLSQALLEEGRRPVIMDADLNGPTQARLAGLRVGPPMPGAGGLSVPRAASGVGVLSLGSYISEDQAVDFPSISSGDSYVWRATKEFSTLAEFLAATDWTPFDTLLLDLPPGAERTFQYAEFLGAQANFVLVTIPSAVSRGVVRRSAAALAKTEAPACGYIENMSGYFCSECGQVRPLFPACEDDLGLPCLGRVSFDPALAAACDRGLTAGDWVGSPSFQEIRGIVRRMSENAGASAPAQAGQAETTS